MFDLGDLEATLERFERHVVSGHSGSPLRAQRNLLREAARRRLLNFDPLRRLGWSLSEHQARDVLCELLDWRVPHGLKSAGLVALLGAALAEGSMREHVRRRLGRMRRLARHQGYSVERELPIELGRVDIAVSAPRFLLFIELKRTGGLETFSHDKAQLRRHLDALSDRAARHGIGCWALIALAPTGFLPSVGECVVVAPKAFAAALRGLEGEFERGDLDAFLGVYSRS